jgi:23S rRNA-/tRNA-specific pseudouridylate synthase
MVAVNKPHGMPVHVAGQYRKNTVLGILTAENPELAPLYPIHRLDKPVSGLLLFARTPRAAATLCKCIESWEVEKVYVARVLGRFPASGGPVTCLAGWHARAPHGEGVRMLGPAAGDCACGCGCGTMPAVMHLNRSAGRAACFDSTY